jgi:hypothetical protein
VIKLLQIDCSETADIIGLGAGTIKWPSKLIGQTAGGIRYRAAADPNGAIVRFKANGADCVLRLKKKRSTRSRLYMHANFRKNSDKST